MKKITLISASMMFFLGACNFTPSNAPKKEAEEWVQKEASTWPQILLTNDYEFKGGVDRTGSGASAFLLQVGKDTFACTAKHLLGDAMGIQPEIPSDSVNQLLIHWQLFPRINQRSNDTIEVRGLVNEAVNEKDILLLNILHAPTNLKPLKPYFGALKLGQKLKIIGCELGDRTCSQKLYNASFYSMEPETEVMYIVPETEFDGVGFSGAPVIDEYGYVVGILTAGAVIEDKESPLNGKEIVVLQSIQSIQKWIKKH
jgi:Trypsin-like peptidase domain